MAGSKPASGSVTAADITDKPITSEKIQPIKDAGPKPSIGRVVHYTTDPHGTQKAAIVTAVVEDSEDQLVDLVVFNDAGAFPAGGPIPFSEEYKPGHWSWPPRT